MTAGRGDESDGRYASWYGSAHRQVLAALVAYCGDLGAAADATDEAFARAYMKLQVCPYATPGFDVLDLRVSGGSLPHAMLVRIGLSGSGQTARKILNSMKPG
jgi:hypothetical protein